MSLSGRSLPIRSFVAPARFVGVEDGSAESCGHIGFGRLSHPVAAPAHRGASGCGSHHTSGVRFGAPARDRPFGHCGPSRHRRSGRVHPRGVTRRASAAVKCGHDRSDASLEVFSPSALAGHVALVPGDAIAPAIPLRPLAGIVASFALMLLEHAAPTHRRRLLVPAVLRSGGVGSIDSARIEAARFDRDAPPFDASLHRFASPALRSCAGDFLRPAFRYPLGEITWLGRAPLGVEACFGFRPVNLADDNVGLSSRV